VPPADDQHHVFFAGDGIMDGIKEYILSVAAAAILCAVVRRLLEKKGTAGSVGKLLTGIFMTVTVLSPLTGLTVGPMDEIMDDYRMIAQEAVAQGEKSTANALRQSISQQMEAYIIEKALALGADIQVEIRLSEDLYPTPIGVRLSGQIAPYAKSRLQRIIEEDLGVGEEDQIWT